MYKYTQFRHESKKWFSRVYLVLINFLLFGLACVLLVAGVAILKVTNDDYASLSDNIITLSKGIAYGLLATGSLIVLLTLTGSIGACTRHNFSLNIYIFGMAIIFIAALAGGIHFLIQLRNNANQWSNLTISDWNSFTDSDRDTDQFLFSCCGFGADQTNIYSGAPLYDSSSRSENSCASSAYVATAPNCYDSGNSFYREYTIISGIVFGGILLFVLTGIASADNAKFRMVDVGYQVVHEGFVQV
ncbi:hypothetical protein HK100_000350 [Physocladia obscura]|uniref:Tetraspanin n=1 Tax=Physocladia obscura TaxID=109957 RepID=A0AAD5SYJ7_9FUNG|nr:hypothetical protein HK100_000350 [Physocladia obscura]